MAKSGALKSRSTRVTGMAIVLLLSGTLLAACSASSEEVSKTNAQASQDAELAKQQADEKARQDAEAG